MSVWSTITDHAARLRALVPSQFRNKPRIKAFTDAIAARVQALEDDLDDLVTLRTLDTATGAALEQYGDLVGEPRGALTDDEEYRRFIRARILVNKATGDESAMLAIVALLFDVDVADLEHESAQPLTWTVTAEVTTPATDDVVRRILRSVDAARPVGVKIIVVEAEVIAFRFGVVGAGFDDGLLARSLA